MHGEAHLIIDVEVSIASSLRYEYAPELLSMVCVIQGQQALFGIGFGWKWLSALEKSYETAKSIPTAFIQAERKAHIFLQGAHSARVCSRNDPNR